MIPARLEARARPGESAGRVVPCEPVSAAPPLVLRLLPGPLHTASQAGVPFLPAPDVRDQVVHTVVPPSGLEGGPVPAPLRAGVLTSLAFWFLKYHLGLCLRLHRVSPCVSASKLPSFSGPWSRQNLLLLTLLSGIRLCDPRDSSPPGSPVHGISQEVALGWAAVSSSGRAS